MRSKTVTIRELKLTEPMTFEGKTFEVPAGTYTLALKGLMSDPSYEGSYHSVYKKEVIHVSERETEFVMDISKQMALQSSQVVVRYRDGRRTKGITEDFAPGIPRFIVAQENGEKEEIWGYTLPGHIEHPQFFLFPVDPKSNNAKVYIVRDAAAEIRFG